MNRAPSFRLLDKFQAGYIKFNGREPRTLEELAIGRADYEHRRRLAEIKAMGKKLALLDIVGCQHPPIIALRRHWLWLNHCPASSQVTGALLGLRNVNGRHSV